MNLVPEEEERLLVFLAAELARKRRAKGLKLSYPEAVALITDEIYEAAREGKSYDEVRNYAYRILTTDDVLPGVENLVDRILVDAMFEDGTHLIAAHHPIREAAGVGEAPVAGVRFAEEPIESNVGRPVVELAAAIPAADLVASCSPSVEVSRSCRPLGLGLAQICRRSEITRGGIENGLRAGSGCSFPLTLGHSRGLRKAVEEGAKGGYEESRAKRGWGLCTP